MIQRVNSQEPSEPGGVTAFAGPPMLDGLVWRDEWKAPYEGPLTILWKLALANCLTPSELCDRLFGLHLLGGDPSGMHGRTLLAPQWMAGVKCSPTVLGQMVRRSGLDMASAKWVGTIAADEHVRYCKACVTSGYQSVYCQIDGLATCPIHGLPLLEECTACGAPTPRYAFTHLVISNPYRCSACDEPLGSMLWSPTAETGLREQGGSDKWTAYRDLEIWMSGLDKLQLFWPHLAAWQCSREGAPEEVHRRIGVFAILSQLITLRLKRACRRMPVPNISMSTHRSVVAGTSAPLRHVVVTQGEMKRNAYVAIRRHIRRILVRHHRSCLRDGAKALHIEWDSELLHPVAPICPQVFAYFLWRHHFEANLTIQSRTTPSRRTLALRDEAIAWPVDWNVGVKAWSKFVVLSFFAFSQVAREWVEQTEGLTTTPYERAGVTALMQLLGDFRMALSPKFMAWTNRVTAFSAKRFSQGDEEDIVIVGPAGDLRETLSPHFHAEKRRLTPSISYRPHLGFPNAGKINQLREPACILQPEVQIAPLERIEIPPELDGRVRTVSRQMPCHIEAETDIEAIKLWLQRYERNPATQRSYQLAVERLLNWAVVERHKSVSSLDDSDLIAFEEFLADPEPRQRWISLRGTARSDPRWTPLIGSLSSRSRLLTLQVVRLMFEWLHNTGYCDASQSLWRLSTSSHRRYGSLKFGSARGVAPKTIGLNDWYWIRQALDEDDDNPQHLLSRLATELMYYGSLSATEVANIRIGHIVRTEHATLLFIPSRPSEMSSIYLLPPVVVTLDRLGVIETANAGALANEVDAVDDQSQHIFLSTSVVRSLIKGVFRRAAYAAATAGHMENAGRLRLLTARSLRHAFEAHSRQFDDRNWVWLLIGAAHLVPAVTRDYLSPRKMLMEVELRNAFHALAPCWNELGVKPA